MKDFWYMKKTYESEDRVWNAVIETSKTFPMHETVSIGGDGRGGMVVNINKLKSLAEFILELNDKITPSKDK